jgi:hypothetical protein
MSTPTDDQSSPARTEGFPFTFLMAPCRRSTPSERLERRRLRNLEMHVYTDEELRDILEMMSRRQDERGELSSDPTFVRKHIPLGLVRPEQEVSLLRRRVETNLFRRLNGQPGSVDYLRRQCLC